MSTVQQLYDSLPVKSSLAASDAPGAVTWAVAQMAQRGFLLTERIDNAGTFAADTFRYAMTTAVDRQRGVSQVFVNETTGDLEVRHRGLSQTFDQSAGVWSLEFPTSIVNRYIGKTFDVVYQYPHPRVDALTDEVYLEDAVVQWWMEMWVAKFMMKNQHSDAGHWANVYIDAQRVAMPMRDPGRLPVIPHVRRKDRP